MATLKEMKDTIEKYPEEGIKINPNWPDEGEYGKGWILEKLTMMIFLSDFPENKKELDEMERNYGELIRKAYEVVKDKVGN